MTDNEQTVFVDCDAGRRLGCRTYCCRLIVRLKPHERLKYGQAMAEKNCVDKGPDGLCVHMDTQTWLCSIWQDRPQTCREYDCNGDVLLQVALREDFTNIVDLACKATVASIPREQYIRVPVKK